MQSYATVFLAGKSLRSNSGLRCRLSAHMRRSKSIETLLPILYLKGILTGDFSEALAALLGQDARGYRQPLSSVSRMCRSTSTRLGRYAICRRNAACMSRQTGIYLQARLEDEKQCILVLIGATPEGCKERSPVISQKNQSQITLYCVSNRSSRQRKTGMRAILQILRHSS